MSKNNKEQSDMRDCRNKELLDLGDYDSLFRENKSLISWLINGFINSGLDLDELHSLANYSFAKALNIYDDTKGKFTTFFCTVCRNEILMELRKSKLDLSNRPLTLDGAMGYADDGSELCLKDVLSRDCVIDSDLECSELRKEFMLCLDTLDERARYCLLNYTDKKMSRLEIAEHCGISVSYVTKLLIGARREVRDMLSDRGYAKEVEGVLDKYSTAVYGDRVYKNAAQPIGVKADVLTMILKGCSVSSIATTLNKKVHTIENYKWILKKEGWIS